MFWRDTYTDSAHSSPTSKKRYEQLLYTLIGTQHVPVRRLSVHRSDQTARPTPVVHASFERTTISYTCVCARACLRVHMPRARVHVRMLVNLYCYNSLGTGSSHNLHGLGQQAHLLHVCVWALFQQEAQPGTRFRCAVLFVRLESVYQRRPQQRLRLCDPRCCLHFQ